MRKTDNCLRRNYNMFRKPKDLEFNNNEQTEYIRITRRLNNIIKKTSIIMNTTKRTK